MICAPAEISENSPTVKNFVRLRTEIFFRQLERIDGGFAGVNLAARVVDHLDELVHGRDVDGLHFFKRFRTCRESPSNGLSLGLDDILVGQRIPVCRDDDEAR